MPSCAWCGAADLDAPVPDADAAVTRDPGTAVAVVAADCVPILMADPVTGAVAAVHAGWRGTAADVVGATVATLTREWGVDPAKLVAADRAEHRRLLLRGRAGTA